MQLKISALVAAFVCTTLAQAQQINTTAQREAMKKLEFLVGSWRGPASISRGPGEPLHLTQSERVQLKLDGLVLLIEGEGRNVEGKIVFAALATVTFDEATATYKFHAHNDGHVLDTELKVAPNGFSWGYSAGPVKVNNTMQLTSAGEWSEITESTYNNTPPRRSVDMKLTRQP